MSGICFSDLRFGSDRWIFFLLEREMVATCDDIIIIMALEIQSIFWYGI
ncbi:hypothetical protein PVOR_16654 [Paenibacillus vortex V453]|uniref:Uncharacterized protein n=1 Tax=Paenibacillus vortex V453 TaxID=715225 RepID=A0A2R9SUD6_9BACL|nr:hypothetical protein PVOR_16654 [Paenibacillus vortex V453]